MGHGRFVVVVPAAVVVEPAVGLLVEVPALAGIPQMMQTNITKLFICTVNIAARTRQLST